MLFVAVPTALLIPVTPTEFRVVNVFCIVLALFWAVLFAAEDVSTRRSGLRPQQPPVGARDDPTGAFLPPPRASRRTSTQTSPGTPKRSASDRRRRSA